MKVIDPQETQKLSEGGMGTMTRDYRPSGGGGWASWGRTGQRPAFPLRMWSGNVIPSSDGGGEYGKQPVGDDRHSRSPAEGHIKTSSIPGACLI